MIAGILRFRCMSVDALQFVRPLWYLILTSYFGNLLFFLQVRQEKKEKLKKEIKDDCLFLPEVRIELN